jgi:hypothetical protein
LLPKFWLQAENLMWLEDKYSHMLVKGLNTHSKPLTVLTCKEFVKIFTALFFDQYAACNFSPSFKLMPAVSAIFLADAE